MNFEIFASLVFIADYLVGLISWISLAVAINLLLVWGIANVRLNKLTKNKKEVSGA